MTFERTGITIHLENEDEINAFWNLIMFAFDYQQIIKEQKDYDPLTLSEAELGKSLLKISEK